MSIKVKNVSKFYGEQKALNDISFEIRKGEIVGFLGPNGAGKSTMMKILTGYIPASDGTAEVCGFNVAEADLEVKNRVGYLPEQNPLYLDMYVHEYLAFVARLHKVPSVEEKVKSIVKVVGLSLEQHKKIGALSKGYRQRVGLASALIHDPEVLILDEPTTGLDPNQIVEIRDLIKSLGKDRTVMLSTHILQEVEAICDKVIIINHGNVVADDSAGNLTGNQNKLTIKVEFDQKVESNVLNSIPGVTDTKQVSETIWLLGSHRDNDIRQAVFKFAVDHDLSVLTIQREELSLEEVFKNLTQGE